MSRPKRPIRAGSRVVQVQVRRAAIRTVVAVTADKRTKHRTERRNSVPCIPVIPFYECLYVFIAGDKSPDPPAAYAAEGCSQERAAPTAQLVLEAASPKYKHAAPQLAPLLQ